jgi:hypothetical protein
MTDTFEEFLEDKFTDTREFCGRAITKDNCEDLFVPWLEDLDPQEFIDLGQEYSRYVAYETASDISDKVTTATLKLHDNWKQK